MKKIYITPKAVAYNVNVRCQDYIQTSVLNTETDVEGGDVKGQLENESVSIWDLY